MVLSFEGFEIEILGDSFVCIYDGTKSQFCEWKELDPRLQNVFRELAARLQVAVEEFVTSDSKIAFDSIAERYETTTCCCRE